eukprot:351012-Chlamydomonas_euryale.AAC.13
MAGQSMPLPAPTLPSQSGMQSVHMQVLTCGHTGTYPKPYRFPPCKHGHDSDIGGVSYSSGMPFWLVMSLACWPAGHPELNIYFDSH